MVPFIVLVSIFIGLVTYWYYTFFTLGAHLKKYKGPRPYPIIGNAHYFTSENGIIKVLREQQEKLGNVILLWIGFRPRLIIADYRLAEQLLGSTTMLNKAVDYNYFHPWLGTGLLTSAVAKWKTQRKLITPTFHFKILEEFVNIFNAQGKIMIEKLREAVNRGPIDIYPYVNMYTLDVICEAAMGIQIGAQNGGEAQYVRSVSDITKLIMSRTVSMFKSYRALYYLTPDYWKQRSALKILHGLTNYVIKSRKKELEGLDITKDNDDDLGIKKRMAFLDLLLQSRIDGEPLPTEVIREEVDTFMFEGHDTTTSGISSILFVLSQNPGVQNKIVEELRSVFEEDKFRAPSYRDLTDMKYLEMVIKETLRLFPPVPLYARELSEDTCFDGGVLPKFFTLVINAHGLHRQAEVWPDPDNFDPERFTPENIAKRPIYAYVPFSAGPRNCIGFRFATLELKSAVVEVLRHYELVKVDGFERHFKTDAILRSHNGTKVQLRERNF